MKKKIIRSASLLLTAVMLLGCLMSCDMIDKLKLRMSEEEDLPFEMYEIISRNMEELDSYVMKSEMSMLAKVDSKTTEITVFRTVTETDIGGKDYTYRAETVTESVFGENESRIEEIEGYAKGKMYRSFDNGNVRNKILSNISTEDFIAHNELSSFSDMVFNEDICKTASGAEYEDGTWKAVFTDFTDYGLALFKRIFGIDELEYSFEALYDGSIDDLQVTMDVNEDLYPTRMTVDIILRGEDTTAEPTVITMTTTYTDHNEAMTLYEDFNNYTTVPDIRIIDKVTKALDEFKSADCGSFEATLSEVHAAMIGVNAITSTKYDVTFERSPKGYNYGMSYESKGISVTESFNGSTRSTSYTEFGQTMTTEDKISNLEAKERIDSLVDVLGFNSNIVTNVQINSDGSYTFTLIPTDSFSDFAKLFGYLDDEVTDETLTLTVSLLGDKITSYDCEYSFTVPVVNARNTFIISCIYG